MKKRIRLAAWCSVPITALVVALVLATSGSASTSHPARINALVVGRLIGCGHGKRGPLHCFAQDRAVVCAFRSRHRLVARETVTNGHFAFLVRPGRLELVARSHIGDAQRSVKAKANSTVHTTITFALH